MEIQQKNNYGFCSEEVNDSEREIVFGEYELGLGSWRWLRSASVVWSWSPEYSQWIPSLKVYYKDWSILSKIQNILNSLCILPEKPILLIDDFKKLLLSNNFLELPN